MPQIPTNFGRVAQGVPARGPDIRGVVDTTIRGIELIERAAVERENQDREKQYVGIKGEVERQMLDLESGLGKQTDPQAVMDFFNAGAQTIRDSALEMAGNDESLVTATENMLIGRSSRVSAAAIGRRDQLQAEATNAEQIRAADTYERAYASARTDQDLMAAESAYTLALRVRLDSDPSYGEDNLQADLNVWRARAQASRVLTLDKTQGEVAARSALEAADALDPLQKDNLSSHIGLEAARRLRDADRFQAKRQEAAFDQMVKQFGDPNTPDPTVTEIIANPNLTGRMREHFLTQAAAGVSGVNPNKLNYQIVNPVWDDIENGVIETEGQLQEAALGKLGLGITHPEYGRMLARVQERQKPEQQAFNDQRKKFMALAKTEIVGTAQNLAGDILEIPAARNMYAFERFANDALDKAENPMELLMPDNPRYLGNFITPFKLGTKDVPAAAAELYGLDLKAERAAATPTLPVSERMKELDAIARGVAK